MNKATESDGEKGSRPLAMIVAVSANNIIGNKNDLPWRLSADLKRFKSITMGHHLIMGRKTFESISRLLPGRTTVIVTRQKNYHFSGAKVVHSIEEALEIVSGDDRPFLVGGAELYRQAMSAVTQLFVTRVHAEVDGDAYLPSIDWKCWEKISSEDHSRDAKNEFDYSFEEFLLKK